MSVSTMLGSGTRTVLVDESFQSFSTVSLKLMVPMMTKKGVPGKLNPVTISNYQDILGYDIDYNGNYLGLAALLGAVSEINVLRLNLSPQYGNVVVFQDGTTYSTDGVTDVDVLQAALDIVTVASALPSSLTQTVAINDTIVPGTVKIFVGSVLYAIDDGHGALVFQTGHTTAATGTISYDGTSSLAITFPTGTSTTQQYTVQYVHDSDAAIIISMKTPGDWEDLSVSISRFYETLQNYATGDSLTFSLPAAVNKITGAYRLEDVSGNVLATSGSVTGGGGGSDYVATITGTGITGSIDFTTLVVTLAFDPATFPAVDFPMLLNHRYMLNDAYFLLQVYQKIVTSGENSYVPLESNRVSFVSTQADFAESVVFDNISIKVLNSLTAMFVGATTPVDLLYGDDGTMPSSAQLDFSGVDQSSFNLICMNGIIGSAVVSAFVQYFEAYNIMTLWDIPNLPTSQGAAQYAQSVYSSVFEMCYWVADNVVIGSRTYLIYPSVKAALAYARMFQRTGTLDYPPAGYDYAAVSASMLSSSDASINAAFLKINKINYITSKTAGPVIWEQRTRNPIESEMSYGSTVMTYVDFAGQMKSFMDNFPFRYITPEILVAITTGLQAIVTSYINSGFVWSATVDVPSFADVQASGARFMTISVNVTFAEDGEEFTFNFNVQAPAAAA